MEDDEFGICLNDEEFAPFIEELLENSNYGCCQELIKYRKFRGEREACSDFSISEIEEGIEIDENSEFGRELITSIRSGQFNMESLEELLLKEQIRNIDFKNLTVEKYSQRLKDSNPEVRNSAISTLGALIVYGNKAAFQELFVFLQQLPPPKTIEEVHFKKTLLLQLDYPPFKTQIVPALLDELNTVSSNNTTRQWITTILEFLERNLDNSICERLENMLSDKRFTYRIKAKIRYILHKNDNLF